MIGIVVIVTVLFCGVQYAKYTPVYRCEATFTVGTDDKNSGNYSYYYAQNKAGQLSKAFPYVLNSNYFRGILLERMGASTLNGVVTAKTVSSSNITP